MALHQLTKIYLYINQWLERVGIENNGELAVFGWVFDEDGLKGTSAQFGAIQLSSIALELETLARNKVLDNVDRVFKELQNAQEQVACMMLLQISRDINDDKKTIPTVAD